MPSPLHHQGLVLVLILLINCIAHTFAQSTTEIIATALGEPDYQTSLMVINDALRTNPDDELLFIARAEIHTRNNEPKLAIADYDSAITLNPALHDVYSARANLKNDIGDIRGAEQDRITAKQLAATQTDTTLEILNRKITETPTDPQLYYDRGFYKLSVLKDHAGAVEDFAQYLKLEPEQKNSLAFRYKATAHQALGQHDLALETIDNGLTAFPKSNRDRQLKAEILQDLGRQDDSAIEKAQIDQSLREKDLKYLEMFREMLRNNPQNDHARRRVAELEKKLGLPAVGAADRNESSDPQETIGSPQIQTPQPPQNSTPPPPPDSNLIGKASPKEEPTPPTETPEAEKPNTLLFTVFGLIVVAVIAIAATRNLRKKK